MATHKPRRLRRELSKVTASNPAFAFYSDETGAIYDEDIREVIIHRGKGERGGGFTPSTLEISVLGVIPAVITGKNCRFFMRDLAAEDIGAHTGQTGANIAMRFQGRAGVVTVDDYGRDKYQSTVSASSWLARMRRSTRTTTPVAGQNIKRIFNDVLDLTNSPRGVNVIYAGSIWDTVATTQEPVTFADAESKFGSDIGMCFFENRDGSTTIMNLPYRQERTDSRAISQLPMTRSQAISPAQWEQSNEYTPITILYDVTNSNGNIVTRTASIDTGDPLKEFETVDWSYMKSETDGAGGQFFQEAYGRVFDSNTRSFAIPSVTVDLLYLINSDKEYHRLQAGQLLAMQVGDPIFFSNDWPGALRGSHFAEGITETITPTSWTLELQLVRYAVALGVGTSEPVIRPRVWGSAAGKWNEQTKTWGES